MIFSRGLRSDVYKRSAFSVLLSLLAFSVGTFVGKAFTESQMKVAELDSCSTPKAAVASEDVVPSATDTRQAKAERLQQDLDAAAKAEDPEDDREPATANKTTPDKSPQSGSRNDIVQDDPSIPEKILGKYTIQIASVVDEAEASERVTQFKEKGLQAFYVSNDVPGMGKRYRVSLGVFDDRRSAQHYKSLLEDQRALPTGVIIKKITLSTSEKH